VTQLGEAIAAGGFKSIAGLRPDEASVFSLPPSHFLGMLIAGHDNPEYVTFTGLTVLLLGLIGLRAVWRSDRRAAIGLSTLIAIAVVVALGSNTPLYELLYRLPGVSLLRVPARAWIVVAFAAALLCGAGVDALAGQLSATLAKKWKLAGWLAEIRGRRPQVVLENQRVVGIACGDLLPDRDVR